MASYNRVILVGNLTRDVELRYIPSGTAVTDISLAVNDRIKKNNEWVDETTFVDVTLWGRTAEVAGEYLSKGSPVLIEGRLKQERWEQEGQKRSKIKVVADKMQMLSSRGGGGGNASRPNQNFSNQGNQNHQGGGQQSSTQPAAAPQGPPPDGDVPF